MAADLPMRRERKPFDAMVQAFLWKRDDRAQTFLWRQGAQALDVMVAASYGKSVTTDVGRAPLWRQRAQALLTR